MSRWVHLRPFPIPTLYPSVTEPFPSVSSQEQVQQTGQTNQDQSVLLRWRDASEQNEWGIVRHPKLMPTGSEQLRDRRGRRFISVSAWVTLDKPTLFTFCYKTRRAIYSGKKNLARFEGLTCLNLPICGIASDNVFLCERFGLVDSYKTYVSGVWQLWNGSNYLAI